MVTFCGCAHRTPVPLARAHPPTIPQPPPPPPQRARRAPTAPTQPHAAPFRSPAPRPCAAPHCCAPAPPRTAAPLHRTTLRPCAAPTQPHAAPLRGPTQLRPCAAPRSYAPARPHTPPRRSPTLRPCRRTRSPQRGPHRARRRPCTRAPRSQACAARVTMARPPTPWSGAVKTAADHRPVRPRRPAAATGPAPA